MYSILLIVDMTTDDKYVCFFHMCRKFMYHVFSSIDFVAQNFKTPTVPISQGAKLPLFSRAVVTADLLWFWGLLCPEPTLQEEPAYGRNPEGEFPETHEDFERPGFIKRVSCWMQWCCLQNHFAMGEICCWLESWSSILGQLEWEQWLWDYETLESSLSPDLLVARAGVGVLWSYKWYICIFVQNIHTIY